MPESGVTRVTNVATPASAAETLIIHTPVVGTASQNLNLDSLPGQNANTNALIRGMINITAGAGCTAVVIRCRRGNGVSGGVVFNSVFTHTIAAGASAVLGFVFLDAPSPTTDYSITVSCTGQTGAGNVIEATVSVSDY